MDYIGKTFGKLTVKELTRADSKHKHYKCECTCGNILEVRRDYLTRKKLPVDSCKDCRNVVNTGQFKPTHGDSKTRFYAIFRGMQDRCSRKSHPHYNSYGGRGIRVIWNSYEEFKKDMYESYLKHVRNYGESETTIERIDVNGNYSKDNCCWATHFEQSNNLRNNIKVYFNDGTEKTLSQVAKEKGLSYSVVYKKYNKSNYAGTGRIPYNVLFKDEDIV